MIETHPRERKILGRAMKKGKLAHSFLFAGPEGSGKRTLALEFGQALLCDNREFPPCRACGSCRRVETAAHPDLTVVTAETRRIKINQIRELSGKLHYHSFEGGAKVGVLVDADAMTEEAQNAFLKTLEEPPDDTVLIMTAVNLGRLLPTILSRCQVLRLGPLPEEVVRELVRREKGLDEEKSALVAALAQGNARRALDADPALVVDFRKTMIEKLIAIDHENLAEMIDFAEKMAGSGYDHDLVLEILGSFFADVMHVKLGRVEIKNRDLAELARQEARRSSLPQILDRLEMIKSARSRIIGNANARLTWEILTMSLKDVPGAEIHAP